MSYFESDSERRDRWDREDKQREIEYDDILDDEYGSRGSGGGSYGGGSSGGGGSAKGCFTIIIILAVIFGFSYFIHGPGNDRHIELQEQYSAEAISKAKDIELNEEYKEKTHMNRMSPNIMENLYKWKGYSFELTEDGTVDVEYKCKFTKGHGTYGPTWVIWRLVDKNTGEVLEKSVWADLEHDPFYLEKGEYVLEFTSISNQLGFDGRRRPFTFTVNFTPD